MVEHDGELHVVIASPPSVFDAAVLLRTLYTGIGVSGWKASIIGLGGRQLVKLVSESRVPVSVLASRVSFEAPEAVAEPVYVVDNRGEEAWRISEEPAVLVVDYAGFFSRSLGDRVRRVRGAGFPSITYEAVTVIYEFFIRRRRWGPGAGEAFSADPRSGLYLARKVLEALTSFDNYFVLEPSTLVYTIRRVYMGEGVLVDPEEYRLRIDPVSGRVDEEIAMAAYSRSRGPRRRGTIVVRFDGSTVVIEDWRGVRYRIVVDPYRGIACAAPGLCAGDAATGEVLPPQGL